ncbi:MAG: response regulator [Candidatus Omnitrophica bacterium]|nr:response regulator [Candidatus Omnitrophota bacterium]
MNKKKILVVDDEIDFLKVMRLNLEETGRFEVVTLESAKEIIPSLHSFRPDLILLDLLMPGTGGMEVCEMLNADPIGQEVPVIVLSALDKYTDKLKAFQRGVVDYLVKPIEKGELITSIDKAFQSKYGQ